MAEFKVAVLDDYQGLSKTKFSKLDPSRFEVHYLPDTLAAYNRDDTPQSVQDELVKRLEPFQIISTMRERTPFPEELISRLPNLKLLLTSGTRNASLNLPAFADRGIPVAGSTGPTSSVASARPGAGTDSTTQHTVALILALARNIAGDDAEVKAGGWQTGLATGLSGKTLGVVGLGRLGVSTARILHLALGMRIIAWSTNLTQDAADEQAQKAGLPVEEASGEKTFKVVSREELFSTADVVSVHLVLSDRSRGLITANDLGKMKPTSFFINTSRAPLVVEKDLLDTIKAGKIAGVAVDVYEKEPLPKESQWRNKDWGKNGTSRVVVTPHMGYVQENAIGSWYEQQVANIERWVQGEALQNVLE